MVQRELTANELKEFRSFDNEIDTILFELAERIEKGERIKVKEKTTNAGIGTIVVYEYSKTFYRYVPTQQIVLPV